MSRPEYYGNPAGVTDDLHVVRTIYQAFARRDLAGALPYIAPDCELHATGTATAAGRSSPYRGHDGVREYFADVSAVWDELVLHAEDFRVVPGPDLKSVINQTLRRTNQTDKTERQSREAHTVRPPPATVRTRYAAVKRSRAAPHLVAAAAAADRIDLR